MPVNLREERRRRGKSLRAMAEIIKAETGTNITRKVLVEAEMGSRPRPENQLALATFYKFDLLEQWPEPAASGAA